MLIEKKNLVSQQWGTTRLTGFCTGPVKQYAYSLSYPPNVTDCSCLENYTALCIQLVTYSSKQEWSVLFVTIKPSGDMTFIPTWLIVWNITEILLTWCFALCTWAYNQINLPVFLFSNYFIVLLYFADQLLVTGLAIAIK